jgi:hypothetical protein
MAFALYILAIGALALVTAYARNFQRTIVDLQAELGTSAFANLTPRAQWARTAVIAAGWPVIMGVGMLFVAWWKAVALVVGGFLLLVPLLGSFMPRAGTPHYVEAIQRDLARRIGTGAKDAEALRRLGAALEALKEGSEASPP